MRVQFTQQGDKLYVSINGAIDNDNTKELNEQLQSLLQMNFKEAIFDFSALMFICSSGIGKFLLFYKQLRDSGRCMRAVHLNKQVFDVFQLTNMSLLFPIEKA